MGLSSFLSFSTSYAQKRMLFTKKISEIFASLLGGQLPTPRSGVFLQNRIQKNQLVVFLLKKRKRSDFFISFVKRQEFWA